MHRTCFVRMVNNSKYRGDVQALRLLWVQEYACVLGSFVCVKQCIVVFEYSCFLLLLQPFEHETARSFICYIGHTAPDIRLTRARFPPVADTFAQPVRPRAHCFVLRSSLRPPPRLSSPPLIFRVGRPPGQPPVLLGAPRRCPAVFLW